MLAYLDENDNDIALLQETSLKRGDKNIKNEILEYGYKLLKTSRQSETNGGGLAVLYKSHIQVQNFSSDLSVFLLQHHNPKWHN